MFSVATPAVLEKKACFLFLQVFSFFDQDGEGLVKAEDYEGTLRKKLGPGIDEEGLQSLFKTLNPQGAFLWHNRCVHDVSPGKKIVHAGIFWMALQQIQCDIPSWIHSMGHVRASTCTSSN